MFFLSFKVDLRDFESSLFGLAGCGLGNEGIRGPRAARLEQNKASKLGVLSSLKLNGMIHICA